ncbi:MAG TPA: hypothetical protein VG204_20975 [Terriglobia bacterium]|nr:hypothetical protein [Terriglobia bacterium]
MQARAAFVRAGRHEPRLAIAEVFCRLILCDGHDIGPVEEIPPEEPLGAGSAAIALNHAPRG